MIDLLVHALPSAMILGVAAWASNVWPGVQTWRAAAVSRLVWWAVPFGWIALLCGVEPGHAAWLASAAWLGAWVPHTSLPDVRSHPRAMLLDLAVAVLRVAGLLSFPAGVFWTCGAWWFAMVFAVAAVPPCVALANAIDPDWPGMRSRRQLAGVLFGLSTGFWVAAAILIPDPMVDRLG